MFNLNLLQFTQYLFLRFNQILLQLYIILITLFCIDALALNFLLQDI